MTRRNLLRLTVLRAGMLAAVVAMVVSVPIVIGVLRAQTLPPPPQHKFDVASIRPGDPTGQNIRIGPGPQGGMRTENTSAMTLITFAYDLREFQLTGGPGWVRTDRFNVTGTPDVEEEAPSPTMERSKMESMFNRQRQRMQSLLIERFGLILRAETREMPIYGLSVAKGGHKLTLNTEVKDGSNMRMGRGRLMAVGNDLPNLSRALSSLVGRTVVDETGLKGLFDMKMEWTPDGQPGDAAAGETAGPSIFTAIQEQLGLKLESKKGPVPVFVIEKIEKPTEN
jgi:uncharacterized protein (TIGR03435 family)